MSTKRSGTDLKLIIQKLRGVENINQSLLELIILELGPNFDELVKEIHKSHDKPSEANFLVSILLEFFIKFGAAIQSRPLLKFLNANRVTLCQYNPKHKTLRLINEFTNYDVFSSGTNATGEVDVCVQTESGTYVAFSAKANNVSVEGDKISQELAFGKLDTSKMGEFKTTYKAKVSAIVVDKSSIRIPANQPEVREYLIDRELINLVAADCYQYATEARDNNETILQRLNKGAVISLLPHQDSGVHQISELMIKYENNPSKLKKKINKILVHYHPRSGKIILTLALMKAMKFNKALVLTQFPYLNQEWFGTVKKYAEFSDIEILDIPHGDIIPSELDPNKKYLILGSLQGSKADQNKNGLLEGEFKYRNLFKISFDLLVADEAHEAFLTVKTAKILGKLNRRHELWLTGTANKLLVNGEFNLSNTISWDLIDRENFINDPNVPAEMKTCYQYHPKLVCWLVQLKSEFYNSISKYIKEGFGFSFQQLLMTMGEEETLDFVHKGDVVNTLQYLLGDRDGMLKSTNFPEGAVAKIYKEQTVAHQIRCKLGFDPRCTLIFVDSIKQQKALQKLLNTEFKNWLTTNNVSVFITNSQDNNSSDVQRLVKELNTYPTRTIVIAVGQLQLGVTIKTCDLVVLMTDTTNITDIEQMSYRPLSEDLSVDKKFGIVLDLNPSRSLMVSVQEIRQNPRYNNKSTAASFIEKHSAIPLFQDGKLLDVHNKNEIKDVLKDISQKLLEQNGITGYFKLGGGIEGEFNKVLIKKLLKIKLPAAHLFSVQEGQIAKGKIFNGTPSITGFKPGNDPVAKAREVARYLLSCLPWLLLVAKQLNKELNSLKEVVDFYSQAQGSVAELGAVKYKHLFAEVVFGLNSLKSCNAKEYYEILSMFKKIQDIDDDIKRFHEDFNNSQVNFKFLGSNKNTLKNILGQVVTPIGPIKTLVDTIPTIEFTKPDNTFCDKFCGSGGILVEIFYRLDAGLKDVFPNEERRHQHILENMLFGSDIVTKNVLITQLRLNPHKKYKLNIKVRDSLTDFNFPKNCIVVSNPATENIPAERWDELKEQSNFKINRIDMVALDISAHCDNVKSIHFILPSTVTTNKKSQSARNFINNFNISKIHLFGDKEIGANIGYEFMVLAVSKTPKTDQNIVQVTKGELTLSQKQNYICDETLPHWVLFRDKEIDLILNSRQMGALTAYRDRFLSNNKYNTSGTGIRVLTSAEVTVDGIKEAVAGVSKYVDNSVVEIPVATLSYMNRPNLYLAPNLVSKTSRVVRYGRDCIVDGTFAVLTIKDDPTRELSDEELAYFATPEFKDFYEKVTNYQKMSKNLDGGFIYWWGILKKT